MLVDCSLGKKCNNCGSKSKYVSHYKHGCSSCTDTCAICNIPMYDGVNEVYLVEILEDRYYFLETLSTARDLQYLIVNKDKLSTWIKLISEPHIIKVDAVEILNDPTHVQMLESKGRQKLEIVSKLTEDFYEMEIK